MVRDVNQDNKKCGDEWSFNRVFKLIGTNATKEICLEECVKSDKCIAMSGIWGSWCIGCQVNLDEPHKGAEAWKGMMLFILKIIDALRNFLCSFVYVLFHKIS